MISPSSLERGKRQNAPGFAQPVSNVVFHGLANQLRGGSIDLPSALLELPVNRFRYIYGYGLIRVSYHMMAQRGRDGDRVDENRRRRPCYHTGKK